MLQDMYNYEKDIEETDEVLTIEAHFQPLILSSMFINWEEQVNIVIQ